MAITKRRVQAYICQLSSPNVLLLSGDIRKDNLAILQTQLLGRNVDIRLTNLRNKTMFIKLLGNKAISSPEEISEAT